MKEVSTIVMHYENLEEQCQKLRQLSFTILAKNLQDASLLAISTPAESLQKSLLVLEEILYEIYRLEMHTEPKIKNVRMLLNNRSFVAQIHPRRIYLLMNLIHKMTSHASNDIVEAKAAKIVLDYLHDIVEWFMKRYDRSFRSARPSSHISELPSIFDKNILQHHPSPEAYEHAAKWFEVAAKWGGCKCSI